MNKYYVYETLNMQKSVESARAALLTPKVRTLTVLEKEFLDLNARLDSAFNDMPSDEEYAALELASKVLGYPVGCTTMFGTIQSGKTTLIRDIIKASGTTNMGNTDALLKLPILDSIKNGNFPQSYNIRVDEPEAVHAGSLVIFRLMVRLITLASYRYRAFVKPVVASLLECYNPLTGELVDPERFANTAAILHQQASLITFDSLRLTLYRAGGNLGTGGVSNAFRDVLNMIFQLGIVGNMNIITIFTNDELSFIPTIRGGVGRITIVNNYCYFNHTRGAYPLNTGNFSYEGVSLEHLSHQKLDVTVPDLILDVADRNVAALSFIEGDEPNYIYYFRNKNFEDLLRKGVNYNTLPDFGGMRENNIP